MKIKRFKITNTHFTYFSLLVISLIPVIFLALGDTLVYGDISYTIPGQSNINFLYTWGAENFGTNVRQGLFSIRSALLLFLSGSAHIFYILNFLLPLALIPITYFYLSGKIGVKNNLAKLLCSALALYNPIIIGDFSKAQSFWVYLTVPWAVYFVIDIFYRRNTSYRNFILFTLSIFLTIGFLPPIALPLVIVLAIMALFFLFIPDQSVLTRTQGFKKIIAGSIASVVALGMLMLPYLVIVPSGQAAYKPVSSLSDYYHNYSQLTLDNVFRLAGNNGNALSLLGYNNPSLINAAGIIIFLLIICALILRKREDRLIVGLVFTILLVLGFMALLATRVDIGTAIFQSQFIASTIRDPTKIFGVVLVLYIFAFGIALEVLFKRARSIHPIIIFTPILLIVCIYAWPIFYGNFGLHINRASGAEQFKVDGNTAAIVANEIGNTQRAIIVPSGHREELNYQNISPSLNTLRLGGALPYTTQYVDELKRSIQTGGSDLSYLLENGGINRLYLSKDRSKYTGNAFGLISGLESYEQTKELFDRTLQYEKETETYILYAAPKSVPMISSPVNISQVDNELDFHHLSPLLKDSTVVQSGIKNSMFNYYTSKDHLSQNDKKEGYAQLYSTEMVEISIERASDRIYIWQNFPLTQEKKLLSTQDIGKDAKYLLINDSVYPIPREETKVMIRSSISNINLASSTSESPTDQDLGFDNNSYVGDAQKNKPGDPSISSKIIQESTDNSKSLYLETKNHTAFASRRFTATADHSYRIEFSYKNLSDEPLELGIYNTDDELLIPRNIILENSKSWARGSVTIPNLDNDQDVNVNIYLRSVNSELSSAQIDDMTIEKIIPIADAELQLDSYQSSYPLTPESFIRSSSMDQKNYIRNGSFELDNLPRVFTTNPNNDELAKFDIKFSNDSTEANRSLYLGSMSDSVYIERTLDDFDNNKIYKISFDYKNISGNRPSYMVWQDGVNTPLEYGALPSNQNEWKSFETTFVPNPQATGIRLYLYTNSNGTNSANLFDNLKAVEQPLISNYLTLENQGSGKLSNIVTDWEKVSPTKYIATLNGTDGLLRLNESFHSGWKAFIVPINSTEQGAYEFLSSKHPGYLVPDEYHMKVGGFANGWIIDSELTDRSGIDDTKYAIVLEYWPQRSFAVSYVVAATTIVILVGALAATRIRQLANLKDKRHGG